MRTDAVEPNNRILEQVPERRRVQAGHVIAFEEGIHHKFPVGGDLVAAMGKQMHRADVHRLKLGNKLRRDVIETRSMISVQPRPDNSASFHNRQRH